MSYEHADVLKASYQGEERAVNKCGEGQTNSPLDRFRVSLGRTRLRALEEARRAAALASLGPDRVISCAEAARVLGLHTETVRLRFAAGAIPGAYLERRAWWIRRTDLVRYVETQIALRADLSLADYFKEGA